MKSFKKETEIIHVFLSLICLYFISFFCFASLQTFFSRIVSGSRSINEACDSVVEQISSEMPIEKRKEWMDSFANDSKELIFVSAMKTDTQRVETSEDYNKISRNAPLSVLLFR